PPQPCTLLPYTTLFRSDPGQRRGVPGNAAAVAGINVWNRLPREHVTGVHRTERWKDDERIAIGMAGTEIKEIDFVFAFAQGEFRSEEHTSELQSPCNLV